ncbi:HAD family phosphatase [Aliiglaciecola sp. 3_MG-2023]|uniref:HAD family hydrolase n=1 Tax=Aliiglaciecola sp. 3_MG-2023 TaxID=3062644 RepID=UPI0026E31116|nr:HAD family phosphatase [Aliiglaciecola sp. 3_MG-2023]MDO6695629.1 HAD family phosphatase [Aliiglaciecola sp. 3_MG-2023]
MSQINTSLSHSSIDLVIFDCDGVLIDSEILSKRVLLKMLDDLGVSISDNYFDSYFLGQSFKSVTERVLIDYSVQLTEQFRANYLEALLQVFAEELVPTDGLKEMLSQLNITNCVATSSSPQRVKFALKTIGLTDYFAERVTTSSEVKNGKPAPDIFLHAASKFAVDPENCLVIEDSQAGIQGALAANMQVVKYAGASHLKDKGLLDVDVENNVATIFDWQQLFELIPSLNSTKPIAS